MKDIYSKDGVVQTLVEENIIHVTWQELIDADVLYASCNAQLEEVKKGAKVVIIDVSQAKGLPPQEVQDWFGNTLFPGFSANEHFKGIINILPSSAIAKLGANRWNKTAEQGPFNFTTYETDSVEAAKKLAQELAG